MCLNESSINHDKTPGGDNKAGGKPRQINPVANSAENDMDNDNLVLGAGTENESDQTDTTDSTDHSLITDISKAMGLESSAERALRRKQKLREALVREHIREREHHKSRLASLTGHGAETE